MALLRDAGHADFRDARGPLGFNQRQSAGKFTRDEAAAFIDRLQREAELEGSESVSAAEQALRLIPAEQLAAELDRRGWIVIAP